MRIARPVEFRNDQILLAHKPNFRALNRNLSPPSKFKLAIVGLFSDNAVNFYECFVVDEIEATFEGDSPRNRVAINIVIRSKSGNNRINVFRVGFYYEVNVASHSRLTVIVHREGTR